ncbi:MAG: hypothetical protein RR619_06780, partial [Raoultibacter sp.]
MGKRKLMVAMNGIACLAVLSLACVAGCSQQPNAPQEEQTDTNLESKGITSIVESDLYNPIVKTLEDGTQIQRTPTEGEISTTLDTSYTYNTP